MIVEPDRDATSDGTAACVPDDESMLLFDVLVAVSLREQGGSSVLRQPGI